VEDCAVAISHPIVNPWLGMKKVVAAHKLKNITELEVIAHEKWSKIGLVD